MIKGSARRVNGTAFIVKGNAVGTGRAVGDTYAIFVQSGRAHASAVVHENKRWRADSADGLAWVLLAAVLCERAINAQAAAI